MKQEIENALKQLRVICPKAGVPLEVHAVWQEALKLIEKELSGKDDPKEKEPSHSDKK